MAIPFAMHGEYVELDQLLKASGFCEPGGATLAVITEGQVNAIGSVKMTKVQCFCMRFLVCLLISGSSLAQTVEYHFSWLGSGSATRTYTFNNVPFEAVITGNAQDVIYNQEQFRYLNLGSPSPDKPFSGLMGTVSGFGGAPLPYYEPLYVQNREGSLFAGAGFGHLGDQQNPRAMVQMTLQEATDLEWYDLKGPVGPVTDSDGLSDIFYPGLNEIVGMTNPWGAQSFTLSSVTNLAFSAKFTGTSSVPEPDSLALLGLAMASLVFAAKRRG